jgi:hypothetical protein
LLHVRLVLALWIGLVTVLPVHAADILANRGDDLQAKINQMACGDTLKMQDGAIWQGAFHIPKIDGCTEWRTFTRQGPLPAVVNTIQCAFQRGPTFLAEMTKRDTCKAELIRHYELNAPVLQSFDRTHTCVSGSGPIFIDHDVDYIRFVGVKIQGMNDGITGYPNDPNNGCANYGLVLIGLHPVTGQNVTTASELPQHLEFDRVSLSGHEQGDTVRAFFMQGNHFTLKNSLVYEIHMLSNDSQCIYATNAQTGVLVENNFLECAGENILFGGGRPQIIGNVPSNIIQRHNYMTKQWDWWQHCARLTTAYGYPCTFAGRAWYTKNVTECKNCQHNAIYGNVIEASWQQNQNGGCVLFQAVADEPDSAWVTVKDIQVFNNVVRHCGQGFNIAGYGGQNGGATMGARIWVTNNLMYGIRRMYSEPGNNFGNGFLLVSGSSSAGVPFDDVRIEHNTLDAEGTFIGLSNAGDTFSRLRIKNNLTTGGQDPFTSVIQAACGCNGPGDGALEAMTTGGYDVTHNAVYHFGAEWPFPATMNPTWLERDETSEAATRALFKSVFTNYDAADFSLADTRYKAGGVRQASDGTDLGVNLALLPSGQAIPLPPTVPEPTPAPVPIPAPAKVCTDGGVTYPAGGLVIHRTTRRNEATLIASMTERAWAWEVSSKVQKNTVDVTFRCVGQ